MRHRVLLADDNPAMLRAFVLMLEDEFEVVGTAANGEEAIQACERLNPDVAVLDIGMPVMDGILAARRLQAAGSETRIVFLTMHPDYLEAALEIGVLQYVLKSRASVDLPHAIRLAMQGQAFISEGTELNDD